VSREKAIAVVVEDEWLLRLEVADALSEKGWKVVDLATGEQAKSWLEQGGEAALLVTDIRLPGVLMGWDVAEEFRNRFPEIVVVYCSANPPVRERQVPSSFFFSKPIRMETVIDVCGAPLTE
jgi:DNA-binding NtrC family response regulator